MFRVIFRKVESTVERARKRASERSRVRSSTKVEAADRGRGRMSYVALLDRGVFVAAVGTEPMWSRSGLDLWLILPRRPRSHVVCQT